VFTSLCYFLRDLTAKVLQKFLEVLVIAGIPHDLV
jgi:hypothetical protein